MFDHVTLRVADLAAAEALFQALLDPLAFDETFSSRTFAQWGDFALTADDAGHPVTRGAYVAFAAPDADAADDFRAAGRANGLQLEGDVLLDAEGNRFAAVTASRRDGNVHRVAIGVADLGAAAGFYRVVADTTGFVLAEQDAERATFAAGDRCLDLVGAGPRTDHLHLAFRGDDDAVRRFYAAATAAGHPGNGEPGERPQYHPGYFAAYVFDPDGNNIEVVDHHR
jgi:catechol 2,3-dioxygenase-like lactoylglutathione lyase family enzyme